MEKLPIIVQASAVGESLKNRCYLYLNQEETVLSFLLHRLIDRYGKDRLVLAVSNQPEDDNFQEVVNELGIVIYRGSYKDLARRLVGAVQILDNNAVNFVRIPANNPLVDFDLMDEMVGKHISGGYEYSYNEFLGGIIWGTGCEVFSVALMQNIMRMNLRDDQLQTLGGYIRQNPEMYKINECAYSGDRTFYKVNIETEKDLEVVRELVKALSVIDVKNISSYLKKHKLLARFNLESPLKETGIEKLLLNERKVYAIRQMADIDYSYPISVELTLTNQCNLRCIYCSDMELRQRQGMNQTLSRDVLFSLFDDLAQGGTRGIVLEGGGEPTLYKEFPEIVRYARKVGLAVGLITNGTQELEPDLLREFEWIRVSLDASTAKEYTSLKGVDCFEKVMANIAHYVKECPSVGVGYVVTNRNISQIESVVLRLREIGVSYIQCRPVVDSKELYPTNIDLSYLTFYQTGKFGVVVEGMVENAESGNHGLPCRAHSITSIISGDGSVYICGRLNIYDWLSPLGNITQQSFHSIWNGDERKRQVQKIQDVEFCQKYCPQCRISKFNVLFDKLSLVKSVNFI